VRFAVTLRSSPRRLTALAAFGRTTRRRPDDNDETFRSLRRIQTVGGAALRAVQE
jgi:hypothetical protein